MSKSTAKKFKRAGRLIIKHHEWLISPAYRSLTPLAKCLLEEFQMIFYPSLNGRLSISCVNAANRLGVNKNTVKQAFYDLVERGFIALVKGSLWQEKLAREWRLTFEPYNGREPTDDWQGWTPEKPVATVPAKKKTRSENSGQYRPKNSPKPSAKFGQSFVNLRSV